MNLLDLIPMEFEEEMASTRKMLERVPETSFTWKPHDKSMTLGRLASHVSDLPQRCVSIVNFERFVRPADYKPFAAETSAALLEHFDDAVGQARAALGTLRDDQLAVTWTVEMNGRVMASLPRAMALRRVFMDHLIHHRGQLSVYLRLLDVPIPGMYGPSADDQARG
ncbi:MAG TPA: DinB family protein [Acidobacteriaceae bacterium]|nr:DinB family protein [Acidobacteriaceae bacterium]